MFQNAFNHGQAKKEGKIIPSEGVDKEFDGANQKIRAIKKSLDEYLKEQCSYFCNKVA